MDNKIKWQINHLKSKEVREKGAVIRFLSKEEIFKAKKFHEGFPEYSKTPLIKLDNLAEKINLGKIYLKDESYRFGLNAFKVLGGSFAMARYIAKKLNKGISELGYKDIVSTEIRDRLGELTFVTATDGNHGRGVAWTANKLKQKAVVYMPVGSSLTRLENIKAEGAEAYITDMNYDDAVRFAARYAETHNGLVIQDTAWEGYEEIPVWIMQGYGTMALEVLEQLEESSAQKPTHVFIQAGVGSLAAAVQGFFASKYGEECPITVVVESNLADCFYKSVLVGDGNPHKVGGNMETIMAGLACGEPNTIAWEILKNYSSVFVSCPDWVSANGMRILGNPLKGDKRVISGESGAVTIGLVYEVMTNPDYEELKKELKLNKDSKVLLFSTEGDTDPEMYRNIVWKGVNEK